ncbi:MAG: MFS transporter [Deltaproteobacteria bacterium]|nr:MFS transporter [Deltaproteobacteria bacterium]
MESFRLNSRYLKTLYFFMLMGAGFVAPFATIFYKHTLLNSDGTTADDLIGWIYFFMPLAGIAANIPAGIAADRLHLGRHLITFFCFGAAVFTLLTGLGGTSYAMELSLNTRFIWIFSMVMLYSIFQMPIIPTVDAETMSLLNTYNKRESYGTFRVYGTAGWSVACIIMGFVLDSYYYLPIIFYATAIGFAVLGFVSLKGIKSRQGLKRVEIPWKHLKEDKLFRLFLVFALLNGIVFNASFIYTSYFFDDVLETPLQIGLIFGTWTVFEIPIMIYSKKLIGIFGNRWLIIIGLFLNGIRLVIFSLFTLETPFFYKWAAATIQGAAFGMIHLGSIDFIDRQSHHKMRSTYMNIANVARITLASAIGGKLGAMIISKSGAGSLMLQTGIASILLIIFFYMFVKGHGPEKKTVN